jgi:hypothetical protein
LEQLAGEQGISDHKDVMKKFRNQIKPLAVSVSFWWLWVSETLQGFAVDKDLEDWLTTTLLPVVYWHQHLHLTQNSQSREHYRKAWTQASHTNMKMVQRPRGAYLETNTRSCFHGYLNTWESFHLHLLERTGNV